MAPDPSVREADKLRVEELLEDYVDSACCGWSKECVLDHLAPKIVEMIATTRQAAEEGQRERDAKVAEDYTRNFIGSYEQRESTEVVKSAVDRARKEIASAIRAGGESK